MLLKVPLLASEAVCNESDAYFVCIFLKPTSYTEYRPGLGCPASRLHPTAVFHPIPPERSTMSLHMLTRRDTVHDLSSLSGPHPTVGASQSHSAYVNIPTHIRSKQTTSVTTSRRVVASCSRDTRKAHKHPHTSTHNVTATNTSEEPERHTYKY